MLGQPYRDSSSDENSDGESSSAHSAGGASKATTNESWHDVKSDNEQEKLAKLDNASGPKAKEEVRDNNHDDDDDDEDESLIKSIDDIYGNGSVKKTVTNEDQSESEREDNSSHDDHIQQTAKVDNSSVNVNPANNNTLTSLNPSEEILSNSTELKQNTANNNDLKSSLLNQQQTLTSTNDKEVKPWSNPYWSTVDKNSNEQSIQKTNNSDSSTAKTTDSSLPSDSTKKSWENPYWKDKTPTVPSSAPPQQRPWENPYWKDKTSTTSSTAKSQDKSWENPYWKDKTPTVPSSAPPQNKPWENPYWKDKASTTSSTAKSQDKSWENPYWKDKTSAIPSSAPPRDKAWENPYWKDKAPTTSSTAKPQDKSWENPYWKDKTSSCNGTSKQQDKPWENPYWKDKKTSSVIPVSTYETSTKGGKKKIPNDVWTLDNDSPPDHKVSPVPPFYQRIYPPPTSQTSSQYGGSIKNSLNKSQSGKRLLDQSYNHYTDENDDTDALPYTTDGDGVVRYRKLPASTCVSSSKRPSVTGELLKSQNLISTPTKTIPLSPQENNPTISALVSSNVPKPSQHNNESSSSSPSQPNFETFEALNYINRLSNKDGSPLLSVTYGELCDVQKALRAVETRSNNISTIESYQSKSLKQSNSNVTIPHSGYDNPAKIVDSHPQSTENLPPRINSANKFSTPNESLNRFMKNGPAVHI